MSPNKDIYYEEMRQIVVEIFKNSNLTNNPLQRYWQKTRHAEILFNISVTDTYKIKILISQIYILKGFIWLKFD